MRSSMLTFEEYIEHPEVWGTDLPLLAMNLFEKGYKGISAVDFYDSIFGDDLEEHRLPEDYVTGEYAAFALEKFVKIDVDGHKKENCRKYVVTKGNAVLYDLIDRSDNFCMIAPVSYAGKTRTNKNARYIYAMCIEVDDLVSDGGLEELIYSWERKNLKMPKPTYLVCSGNGIHLYYVFKQPLPMFANIFEQLQAIKKFLTPFFWTKFISNLHENIQYESLTQPFRCVGSRTKKGGYTVAFECGDKISIEYLNSFLPQELKLNCFYKSKHTLKEAKILYPEWYQKRIVRGLPKGHWNRHKPIYFNWIEKIMNPQNGAQVGKRYNCLENLCSLAVQCNIDPEQVETDCRKVAKYFESLTIKDDNHFTEYDILCALKTYYNASEQAYNRSIEVISKKTGIELKSNKRNGQKQIWHLEDMRTKKVNMKRRHQAFKNPEGRPNTATIIYEWRVQHPDGIKADCIRDTKLSKKTVYRWWEWQPVDPEDYINKILDEEARLWHEQMNFFMNTGKMRKDLAERIEELQKMI